jgi:DNA-directed RNA polymerase subunit beta
MKCWRELDRDQWFKLKLSDNPDLNEQLASAQRLLEEQNTLLEERFETRRRSCRAAMISRRVC